MSNTYAKKFIQNSSNLQTKNENNNKKRLITENKDIKSNKFVRENTKNLAESIELKGSLTNRQNKPESTMGKWDNLLDRSEKTKLTRCNSQKSIENAASRRTLIPSSDVK